jgi:uncharacterized protein (PEP-CTERM system associated)
MNIKAPKLLTVRKLHSFFAYNTAAIIVLFGISPLYAQTASSPSSTPGRAPSAIQLTTANQSNSQALELEPAISAELEVSDNGNFGSSEAAESETTLIFSPRLNFRRQSPDWRLDGSIGLTSYTYANNTRENNVLPRLDVFTQAALVRDLLTVQAGVQTRDFLLNTLDAENQGGVADSRYNAIQTRVAPELSKEFSRGLEFEAKSENSWTTYSGDNTEQLAEAYVGDHRVSFSQTPESFGWFLRASRSETKYDVVTFDRFVTDQASAGIEYALTDSLTVGVGAGKEENTFPGFSAKGDTALVNLKWRPTNTTRIEAEGEKRFFGDGWRLDAQHRSALFVLNVTGERRLSVFQQELLSLPRSGTTAELIDQALVGRITDPYQRAQAVQDLINSRGLPTQLDQATSVYSERIQLVQSASVSLGLLGVRNSIIVSATRERAEDLSEYSAVLESAGIELQSGVRTGFSVGWNHRLSPTRTIDTELTLIDSEENIGLLRNSRQTRLQAVYALLLSPRTALTFGIRFQRYTLDGASASNESALLATFDTRF